MSAGAAWPGWARVEADGYAIAQDPDTARTAFDDGMVRQERRYTAALAVRRVTAWLEDDDALVRFRAWAAAHAHRWFAWTDPEDGRAREVRVRGGAGGIVYRARAGGGRRGWTLACEIEGDPARTIAVEGRREGR